jgi:multicomponent Na+:H+ antiporter subunit B
MIKRVISLIVVLLMGYILYQLYANWQPNAALSGVARDYVQREPQELGAVNVVTAIVVTYRGLDTLGEVSVLFLAATGVAVLLRRREKKLARRDYRAASEILTTGAALLTPFIVMFGAYIFINGHLSPGGGFQGGAVIASAVLLLFLAYPDYKLKHSILNALESVSGAGYVLVGILGIILAGGFLDNRILPLGEYGKILSAGAIPVIYTFIGLKVGTELAGILENLKE